MGHSRKAHDKYYRLHLGHNGLTRAFQSLEKFQTYPDLSNSDVSSHSSNNSNSLEFSNSRFGLLQPNPDLARKLIPIPRNLSNC